MGGAPSLPLFKLSPFFSSLELGWEVADGSRPYATGRIPQYWQDTAGTQGQDSGEYGRAPARAQSTHVCIRECCESELIFQVWNGMPVYTGESQVWKQRGIGDGEGKSLEVWAHEARVRP